ncbi:hypothetical protein F5Y11DRAFT_12084 [Daldinia sp. FL1419]|nr:hypothetical protein F5Y11DRAFT_12084 [Daldinia sp. FL1419]
MNKKTDRDKDGLGYKYLGSRPRPERPPQQAEQAYVNGKQKFPFANKPSPNHSHLYIRLTTTMCRSLDLRSRSFLPQDEMDELSRAMPALTKSDLYNCTTQLLETRWAALSPFLRAPVRDVRLYSFPVQATLGDNQDKYHSNLGLEELHSKRTEEFQREVTFLRPSVDPPPHHVVRFLAAASISRVVEKLQCLRQRCLEDPTYMVVISPARKPPWPTRKLMSLHQNNSSTFKSTTQSTKLNMNQLPRSDGVNPPNLTTSHYQGSFCPSLDGQHYGTGSDITSIDLFSNNMMSMEGIPDNYQFDASPHRHIAAKRRTSFSQSIPINSRSRRRTLDNITSFGSIIDEPKRKRMRERGDAIIENIPQNGLPDIPKQGPTQAAQHEAIRSSRPATVEKLFACPFYKRDPGKYNTKAWKACSIPEGRDISRLKAHIPQALFWPPPM